MLIVAVYTKYSEPSSKLNIDRMRDLKVPDLVFYSTLFTDKITVENVLCHIFLPIKVTDSIEIICHLNKAQLKTIKENKIWRFSIKGETRGFKDRIEDSILLNEVIITDFFEANFSPEYYFSIACQTFDLTIVQLTGSRKMRKVYVTFWLTRNLLLSQLMNKNRKQDKGLRIDTVYYTELALDDITFKFEHYEKDYRNNDKDTVSFYELVANVEAKGESSDSTKILEIADKLDDLTLLASFAIRHRTACLGWEAFDGKTSIKQYLRNRAIPEPTEGSNGINPVIDFFEFREFLKNSFTNLRKYTELDALRRAINLLIPSKRDTIDGGYMILYSALEMLVLHFRRNNNLEFIFPKNQFEKQIRKSLKQTIEKLDISPNDSEKKLMLKDKLSELNRVSFATAFAEFCKHYSVNLDDLWSIRADKSGISLTQIRNKLVHGEHIYEHEYDALIVAKEHLRWTIERMILGVLGWSVNKSEISPEKLKQAHAYQNWKERQKILTKRA